MNAKQERFCQEYVIDLNATRAYIAAGYSDQGAGTGAHKLLKNTKIKAEISRLQESIRQKSGVTAEMVVNELCKMYGTFGTFSLLLFIYRKNAFKKNVESIS